MQRKRRISKVIITIAIALSIIPVVMMVFGSFKSNPSLSKIPPDFSLENLSLKNYQYIWDKDIKTAFFNSLTIAVATTVLVLFLDTLAGYAFARKNFPGKNIFFTLLLSTMMIPKQVLMVPEFILLTKIGLFGSKLAVILSSAAIPFGVFLLKQSMSTLPKEIFEAAEIDGCGDFRQYYQIALPLSKGSIAALGIFIFVQVWNDFMWQLVMLTGKENMTLPLFLQNIMSERSTMYGYQFACSAIATIPILIVFLFLRKYFVSGITAGAVKG